METTHGDDGSQAAADGAAREGGGGSGSGRGGLAPPLGNPGGAPTAGDDGSQAAADGGLQPLPEANHGELPESSLPPSSIPRSPPDNPALGRGGGSRHGGFSPPHSWAPPTLGNSGGAQDESAPFSDNMGTATTVVNGIANTSSEHPAGSTPTTMLQEPLVNPAGGSDAGGVTVTSQRAESRRRFLARRHQAQIGNGHAPQGQGIAGAPEGHELALIGNDPPIVNPHGGQPSSVGDSAGGSDAGGVTVTSLRAESRHQAQIGNGHAPQGQGIAGGAYTGGAFRAPAAYATRVTRPPFLPALGHGGGGNPVPVTTRSLIAASRRRFFARRQQRNASAPQGHRGQSSSAAPEQQSSSGGDARCETCGARACTVHHRGGPPPPPPPPPPAAAGLS